MDALGVSKVLDRLNGYRGILALAELHHHTACTGQVEGDFAFHTRHRFFIAKSVLVLQDNLWRRLLTGRGFGHDLVLDRLFLFLLGLGVGHVALVCRDDEHEFGNSCSRFGDHDLFGLNTRRVGHEVLGRIQLREGTFVVENRRTERAGEC